MTTQYPSRAVLENVPQIGFGVRLCPFPGSLESVMKYLNEPYDYDYVMGVSGAAFRRLWNRDDGGNIDLMYFSPARPYLKEATTTDADLKNFITDPVQRVFDALGFGFQRISPKDKVPMIQAMQRSIAKNKPVLTFGIIGPPECGIITGYDKDGEVAIGYSYFQDGSLPGYYEQPDWFAQAEWAGDDGFIMIGEKKPKLAERETLISTLKWVVKMAKMPKWDAKHECGLAAYDAWAKGLEVDADYPQDEVGPGYPNDNIKVLGWRIMVHGDQCVMLEERHHAANYLRQMTKVAPEATEELTAAAALYDEAANQMNTVWPSAWGYDMGPETQKKLADPTTRREIAKGIRVAREKEAKAVEHLEQVLAKLTQ